MKFKLFEVKKLEPFKEWGGMLMGQRKKEALETLREENLSYEAFAVFKIEGKLYALGMSEGDKKPTNMDKEINQTHWKIMQECMEPVEMDPIKLIYELRVD